MNGVIGRWTRWCLRTRVGSALLLCALALWFAGLAGTYRAADPYLALSVAAGLCVAILTGVLLACRIAVATPSEVSGRVIHVFERYAPLVVINLIVLNIFAPVIGFAATVLVNMPFWRTYLTLVGSLSAQVICWLFVLAIACVIVVAAVRLLDRAALRWRLVARATIIVDRAIIGAAALYCAWAIALTFNGSLDRSPAVEHRGEIVRVWGIPKTPMWWADVRRSESPDRVARVLVFPLRDQVVAGLLAEGQHVRLRIRPGLLRIPWVESMRLDFEHELPALVAAVPSASAPRKWLIETLLRDGRWTEAASHTQIYARYHPADRPYISRVVGMLRQARQTEAAADVGRPIVPVSGTRAR